jgi:hypothetical protein
MKRSIRWYLVWGMMVASVSMLLFFLTAGPALAYTQEYNSFAYDPNTGQYTGNAYCGTTSSSPCMYWQEAQNTSIDLYFYMDPSLQNINGYNFVPAVQTAMNAWNGALAWNPYLHQWHSGNPTFGGTISMAQPFALPCYRLVQTHATCSEITR